MEGLMEKTHTVYAGQAAYTPRLLKVYDAVVYRFNGPILWRCSKDRFLELYNANVSARHLDIGVATGCLLDECRFPLAAPRITLMDLNENSLEVAARRLARYAPITHQANVLEPWGLQPDSYDSVGMVNVLHCVPGAMPAKTVAFEHARTALAPGGVLFGATILGGGVEHTRLSRMALKGMNRRGVFSNLEDSLEDLDAGLGRVFDSHEVHVEGAVALFTAR
ncbi:MAG: class I SAM-dependent methyltransferase [Solirubrobacteraceae bacterium]